MRPPHYREGTPAEHCSNCGAFTRDGRGFCRMYGIAVKSGNTCDKWYPASQRKAHIRRVVE